jgi:membrane protease YdiL (CAAX protease family)
LIIAPVLEELFFRKFLLNKLLEKYSLVTSIIVSSLLFSLIHIETPKNLFPTLLFGILGGLIYIKTRRIAYPILFHFLYNLFIQLLRISSFPLDAYLDGLRFNVSYWLIALLGAILASAGIYRILKMKN